MLGTGQASYAVRAGLVTSDYFDTLRVRPALGRTFARAQGVSLPAIISEQAWREQFDSAPDVIGRAITLDRHPATIVGVAPAGFRGIQLAERQDVWVPLTTYWRIDGRQREMTDRGYRAVELVGVLAHGATLEQAQSEMKLISERLERAYPRENRGFRALVRPYTAIGPGAQPVRGALKALLVVAGLLLVVVSANVANLVLCRSVKRQHELAIRKSLGAPLARMLSLLLTEGLLLSCAAACVGWWAAVAGPRVILHFVPGPIPALDLSPDGSLALYVILLAVLTTLTFTVAPAIGAWKQDPLGALKSRDLTMPSRRRAMTGLSLVQLVLSFVLLAGAGLLERSSAAFENFDPGFKKDGLLFATVNTAAISDTPEANSRVLEQLRTRLQSEPGIAAVSYAVDIPISGGGMSLGYVHGDMSAAPVRAGYNSVGPHYLRTLGAPLRFGRDINTADRGFSQPVAVINERLARALWPGRNPLGRVLRLDDSGQTREIVGVVKDGAYGDFWQQANTNVVFIPFQQQPARPGEVVIHLRPEGHQTSVAQAIRSAVQDVNPLLPIERIATADDLMQNLYPARLFSFLLSLFAGGALVLAAVGLYTTVALSMAQRTREFAVRIALGASDRRVWFEAMRGGLVLIGIGSAIGLAISLAGARGLRSVLFGISSLDPPTFIAVILVLAGTCSAACFVPARRATRADPARILREE